MITKLSVARPAVVVAVWLLLAVGAAALAVQLGPLLQAGGFKDPDGSAFRGQAVAESAFGDPANSLQVVLSSSGPIGDDTLDLVKGAVAGGTGVLGATDHRDDPRLLAEGRRTAVVNVGYDLTDTATQNQVENLREDVAEALAGTGVSSSVTGAPALDYDLNAQSKADALAAEMIAAPLLVLVLLVVYRAVVPTLVTLTMAGLSIVGAHGVGYLVAREVDVSNLFTTGISLIGLAVSVDYSLFVIKRHEEYLASGLPPAQAALAASSTAGHAVRFGGLAVVVALVALFIPGNMVFFSIATAGIVVTVIAIAITTTLLPAVLTLLGHRAFAGRLPGRGRQRTTSEAPRLAQRRPVAVAGVVLAALLAAAVPSLLITLQVPVASASILPASADSRQGLETLSRDLDPATMFPVQVLLRGTSDEPVGELLARAGEVERIARESTRVESVVGPGDAASSSVRAASALEQDGELVVGGTRVAVLADGVPHVRLMVVSRSAPDTSESHALVEELRDAASATGDTWFVAGATSQGDDFDTLVEDAIPVVVAAVFALSLVLLGVAFGSVLLPLVALALNAVVVLAALGLLTLLRQELLDEPINSVTPILMFAIIFGLSMDYMVLMAARMKEEYRAGADHTAAIARGSARTARLVSAAATIMVAVFMSFMVAEVSIVRQLGLGLALAVVLDAAVVRPFLMPAVLQLVGPRVWGRSRDRDVSGRHADDLRHRETAEPDDVVAPVGAAPV